MGAGNVNSPPATPNYPHIGLNYLKNVPLSVGYRLKVLLRLAAKILRSKMYLCNWVIPNPFFDYLDEQNAVVISYISQALLLAFLGAGRSSMVCLPSAIDVTPLSRTTEHCSPYLKRRVEGWTSLGLYAIPIFSGFNGYAPEGAMYSTKLVCYVHLFSAPQRPHPTVPR